MHFRSVSCPRKFASMPVVVTGVSALAPCSWMEQFRVARLPAVISAIFWKHHCWKFGTATLSSRSSVRRPICVRNVSGANYFRPVAVAARPVSAVATSVQTNSSVATPTGATSNCKSDRGEKFCQKSGYYYWPLFLAATKTLTILQ